MQVLSIDIETTGVNPAVHGVTEFAGVLFDDQSSEPPKTFYRWLNPEGYVWSNYCLRLHKQWIERVVDRLLNKTEPIGDEPPICSDLTQLRGELSAWLDIHVPGRRCTVAGKNVGTFDMRFLPDFPFRHRTYDWVNHWHQPADAAPPDLATCKKRAIEFGCALVKPEVAHNALADAMDVACLIQWTKDNWK